MISIACKFNFSYFLFYLVYSKLIQGISLNY